MSDERISLRKRPDRTAVDAARPNPASTAEREPLPQTSALAPERIEGVVIGRVAGRAESGALLVDFPGNPSSELLRAATTIEIEERHFGRDVALLFEAGDPRRPIAIGLIQELRPAGHPPTPEIGDAQHQPLTVEQDGERVVLSAEQEIVLRCGKASITLTRAGKVLIRGAYVLSRSTGVNKIFGGSIQLN